MAQDQLEQVAQDLVKRARAAGATAADAAARDGDKFSTTIRLGRIESLKEAESKGLRLRVFLGTRSASSYSSDFSPGSIERLVERTIEMARVTSEDPANGLPEASEVGRYEGDLQLYSADLSGISAEECIEVARRAERAALGADSRIRNSEGASVETSVKRKAYANSLGFVASYRSSAGSVTVVPVAQEGRNGSTIMQRDYWYSVGRGAAALGDPEGVGREAAARVLRRLGARKISTCRVPVIFDQETARSLVGHVFEAVRGDSIYRNSSFLAGKLGEQIAGANITILDDGLRPGGFGSRPFDDEGVAPGITPVVERGVLRSYLLNSYTARKLNLRTTGNASRGVAGPPGVGPKNFYLQPGTHPPAEILKSVKNGFYVTELIGMGVNVVTGDYSRGAAGMWIENGELAYPVEEVTIAGSLEEMLNHVAIVGSDLEFRSALASPTLLVEGLTVAGT
jgi:PmbA protein